MRLAPILRALAIGVVGAALVARVAFDRDADGAWRWEDCDDGRSAVHPGAPDVPRNGADEDCDGRDSQHGTNVVLLTIDTLRPRNLHAYGYHRETSPVIDQMAADGALFEHAYSTSSWTLPSLASLMTSKHPIEHGTVTGRVGLQDHLVTITHVLRAAGYDTAAWTQSAYPLYRLGFGREFQVTEKPAGAQIPDVVQWLSQRGERPFFLWVHLAEPHTPYLPTKRFERHFTTKRANNNKDLARWWNADECVRFYETEPKDTDLRLTFYDETLRESDFKVGQILQAIDDLGMRDRTIVALTADHGEEFYEHRGCDHGQTLYDEVLHIPLLMRHPPTIEPGVRVAEQVRLIDVVPTILDLITMPPHPDFIGRSLRAHTEGKGHDLPVIGGYMSNAEPAIVFRKYGLKYIYSPRRSALRTKHASRPTEELYDLEADPHERRDLAPKGHPRLEQLREKAKKWSTRQPANRAPQVNYDETTVQRLKALGYLGDDPAE
jgi:arylsulfatase A-like enzyme